MWWPSNNHRLQICTPEISSKFLTFPKPGYFYSAVMTNLQPNTKYFYRFGSENTSYSQISEFVSAPVPTTPVQFAVFGGSGDHEIINNV